MVGGDGGVEGGRDAHHIPTPVAPSHPSQIRTFRQEDSQVLLTGISLVSLGLNCSLKVSWC